MSVFSVRSLPVSVVATCFVLAFAGCGNSGGSGYSGPVGKASGKVTLNGGTIPAGSTVTLISSEGLAAAGTTASDGTFKLMFEGSESIPATTYKVQLSPPPPSSEPQLMDPSQPMPTTAADPFPAKYAASSTSGLSVIISEGDNPPIEIDLK